MKTSTIAAIVVVVVVVIGGVAAYLLTAAPPKPELKVALAFSGLIGDPGFPRLGYEALLVARDTYGAEIAYHEHTGYADIERVLSDFAAAGYTLVWGHGGEYEDATPRVADRFPETYFMTTATVTDRPNLRVYDVQWGQASYLVGIVAGSYTQTNKIGIVIGAEFPPIIWIVNALKAGALTVNPDVEIFVSNVESWIDAPRGKEFALAHIESGADVIFTWADLSAEGVIEACTEEGVYYIAETQDHYARTPSNIALGNYQVDFRPEIEDAVPLVLAGTFTGGVVPMGLEEGLVDYIPDANISEDVADQVEEVRQSIIDGTFQVPLDFEKHW